MLRQATKPDRMTRQVVAIVYETALEFDAPLAFVRGYQFGVDRRSLVYGYLRDHALADLRAIAAADRSPRSAAEIEGILWGE